MEMTTISVNGESFRVQSRNDGLISKKVAKDLYVIKQKVGILITHLRNGTFEESRKEYIDKLLYGYQGVLQEIPTNRHGSVAFNENKGKTISLCLYKDGNHQDMNTAMFVTLHELAHCMTEEYRHNDRFWDNFKFLLKESIKVGVYTYQDFTNNAETFCGMEIANSPYKM